MARSGPVTKDTSSVAIGLAQVRVGSSAAHIAAITAQLSAADSLGALGEVTFNSQTGFFKMESGFPKLEDISIPTSEQASISISYKELHSRNLAYARGIDPNADVNSTARVIRNNSSAGTVGVTPITTNNLGGVVNDKYTVVFTGPAAGSIYGEASGLVHSFSALNAIMAPLNGGQARFSIPANFFTGTWAVNDSFVFETTMFVVGTDAYANNHAGEINLGAMVAPAFVRVEAVFTYPNGINHMYIVFPRANASGNTEVSFADEDAAAPPIVWEAKRADSEVSGGHVVWDNRPLGRIYFD